MQDADLLRRGFRGAWILGVRQLLVQLVSAAAVLVLARVLEPAEFGFYAVTLFLTQLVVVAGDAGLAAALVRQETEPEERDFEAVFTFQQAVSLAIAALSSALLIAFPVLVSRTEGLAMLLPAAVVALLLTSFVTTPVARLERHLRFERLAVLEVGQALVFNGVAVAGALAGLGANAMAAALVARAATGVLVVRRLEPWPRRRRLDWQRVRSRLRFGAAYQATTAVALVREAIVPIYIGATIGSAAVGGVFFAQLLATHALAVVYMLQRVLLPLFARFHDDRRRLAHAVEVSTFAVAAVTVPVQTTVFALQEPIVRIVFGEQWLDSLPVFRWLWLAAVLEPQMVVASPLLNALGLASTTLRLVVVMTLVGWAAGVPLLLLLGPIGYGVAAALQLAVRWRIVRAADEASGTVSSLVVAPVWLAGGVSAAVAWAASSQWPAAGLLDLTVLLVLAVGAYAAVLGVVAFDRVQSALAWIRREVRAARAAETNAAVEAEALP
jgi:O-antigen/teichoic acid export membrane protein